MISMVRASSGARPFVVNTVYNCEIVISWGTGRSASASASIVMKVASCAGYACHDQPSAQPSHFYINY
jgi:hypothetical protein